MTETEQKSGGVETYETKIKCELYHNHFENSRQYNIPRAQLIIADIPYNLGSNAYASNPSWYEGGDNANGESKLAGKSFFKTDEQFNIGNFFDFCVRLLRPEPKIKKDDENIETLGKTKKIKSKSPCMIIFCAFEQQQMLIDKAKEYGFKGYIPIVLIKNYSAQVLKANMKVVGATEHAIIFYRDRLPKFNNHGKMIFNWFELKRDTETPKVHPTQKSIHILKELIEIFTDEGDVVIDPVAGSGTTLRASAMLGRHAYGFEIEKKFYQLAKEKVLKNIPIYKSMNLEFEELDVEKVEIAQQDLFDYLD